MAKMITVTKNGVDKDGYPSDDIIKSIELNADSIFTIEDTDMNDEYEITKITFLHSTYSIYVRESKEDLTKLINQYFWKVISPYI